MKVKKIILLLALTLVLALGLSSCNGKTNDPNDSSGTIVNLKRIVIKNIQSERLDYLAGEPLDISDIYILLEYDDNTVEQKLLTKDMIPDYESFTMAKVGKHTINVVYGNCYTSFDVTVNDTASLDLVWHTPPSKTEFTERTPLSLKGAVLEMQFASGTSRLIKDIEKLVQVTGYNNTELGEQIITVKYAGFEVELEVTVVAREPIAVEVAQKPRRQDYFVDDDFDNSGMKIKVFYNNEESQIFDIEELVENIDYRIEFDSRIANRYSSVKFTYYYLGNTFTSSFNVVVRLPAFSRIELVRLPMTTGIFISEEEGRTEPVAIDKMVQGDRINYATGQVKVYFDDGSEQIYNMSDNIIGKNGFEDNTVGQQSILIYYGGNQEQGLYITANVHYPTAVEMILEPESVTRLQSYDFYQDEVIEEARIEYIDYSIKYNNGVIESGFSINPTEDIYQGNLICDEPGEKTIVFSFGGNELVLASITITVQERAATFIGIIKEPTNKYVLMGENINISGGILKVTYNKGGERQIMFDDPQEEISFTCKQTPDFQNVLGVHTITVGYKGLEAEYQVEVKEKVATSITVSRQPNKLNYMQYDALSLEGMQLFIKYSDNSEETIDASFDMLFENHILNDNHLITVAGNQEITLRYQGIMARFYINVAELLVDRLELLRSPKTIYRLGADTEIDLSNIVIRIYYNKTNADGSEFTDTATYDQIIGNSNWSLGSIDLTTLGEKSFALFYSLQGQVTSLIFYVQVVEAQLISIELDSPIAGDIPLNMDLNLEGIYLLLYYDDGSTKSTPLLKAYTDYDPKDVTPGERIITITYGGCVVKQSITLSDKRLTDVRIDTATTPRANFVLGEQLDLSKGRLRREFDDGSFDFISMSDLTVKISDYNANIHIGASSNYASQTITITYLKYTMSFDVRTYKKLNPAITIAGNNLFYGADEGPTVELAQPISEFELPQFSYMFKVGGVWQSDIPTQVGSYDMKIIIEENIYYNGGEFEVGHNGERLAFSLKPKSINVRPISISKNAGEEDPEIMYEVEEGGLLEGDELTGSLTRDPGEVQGTYLIRIGTLGNPNYIISLQEAYFTIE